VRRAAAHDARAHHDDVEVETVAGGSGLGGHGTNEFDRWLLDAR